MTTPPLYTAPALEFLEQTVDKDWRVFEYGGGHSTKYYSEKCSEVYTVEHDGNWYNTIVSEAPNAHIELVQSFAPVLDEASALDEEFFSKGFNLAIREDRDHGYNTYHGMNNDDYRGYASRIFKKPKGYFDCIVADGMARSLTLWYAMHMLKDGGVIILDNSDRWQYNDLQCYLMSNGLNRLDFWEPNHPSWCTSFFSKTFDHSDAACARSLDSGDLYHF